MRKLPVLRTLQTFEAVCAHPSFSAAAAALGMTHGAISHQIRALETWLGRDVFDRHKGGVRLNENGERLRYACVRAFDLIEDELQVIGQSPQDNSLLVGCSPTLLAHWLLPRIDRFFSARSDISISFETRSDMAALLSGRVDLLIVSDPAAVVEGIDAIRLGTDKIGPVCTPSWKKVPKSPSDFVSLPLLHASSRLNAWQEWASEVGLDIGAVKAANTFDSLSLTIEAARAGLGFAMTPEFVVRSDLADNRLIAPVGFVELKRSTWVCTRSADAGSEGLTAIASWIIDTAAQTSPLT